MYTSAWFVQSLCCVVAKKSCYLMAYSKDSDQTWPTPSLIRVVSGRTRRFLFCWQKVRQNTYFLILFFYVPVNSYGHVWMVSSPYHTSSWASLTKQLTCAWCTYFSLKLKATLLESVEGRRMAVNKYSMINLREIVQKNNNKKQQLKTNNIRKTK